MTERTPWGSRRVALSRRFVAGEIAVADFVGEYMHAHNAGSRAQEVPTEAMDALLDDLLYAVVNHDEQPDRTRPDQLDDDQLRAEVARHLAAWDAGDYG